MRQIGENPKLKTLRLPALRGRKNDCSTRVASCSPQYRNKPYSCHRFYKCVNGVAYSCQNPKIFNKKCSGKYWNFRKWSKQSRMSKYKCQEDTIGHKVCTPDPDDY